MQKVIEILREREKKKKEILITHYNGYKQIN